MKYAVATTENGFIEELEVYGKTYRKEWANTKRGMCCEDGSFAERLEQNGVKNERLLDKFWGTFDATSIGIKMCEIERECM